MNEILGKLNEYLEAAEGLVTEYADDAAQLLLHVIQMEAIFYLVTALVIAIPVCIWSCNKAAYAWTEGMGKDSQVIYAIGGPIISLITGGYALGSLLSFYNWLAAFNPLAGLVYKLIN